MEIRRETGYAPRTRELAGRLCDTGTPCIGCPGCAGLCDALFELILLPDIVLKEVRP